MPARKGQARNSPRRGSRIAHKVRESGPNKGVGRYMRIYVGPDGEIHSAPTAKPKKRRKKKGQRQSAHSVGFRA